MIEYTFNTILPNGRVLFFRSGRHVDLDGKRLIGDNEVKVISIAIMSDSIIIITDKPDIHDPIVYNYKGIRKGNLFAFDFEGNLSWSIDSIIDESLNYSFSGGYIATDHDKELFNKWKNVDFVDGHEYYIAYNNADARYIIDITDSTVIAKRVFRG